MIVTWNLEEEVARLSAELAIRFKMKDLGELHHFLGLEMERKKSAISLCVKKQDSVFVSTTEAEYKAFVLAAPEAIWLRRLMEGINEKVLCG
ncbi:hypothetical protein KSP39_PZI008375 [Platanthera zijinensis]|uniref:Reverse transcriptase n=1 Tax=Platanthera zijinensis TaxID=2320716 RepID=A0AAP0BNC8_9ASPA